MFWIKKSYNLRLVGFLLFFSLYSFSSQPKIALLFLTRGDLQQSRLWETLLKESPNHFNIYIHSKTYISDPYFSKFRIKRTVPTTWSRHLLAWDALLREAIKDKNNYKFIFLSDSCVPLHNLNDIYISLLQDDKSTISFCRPWWESPHPRDVKGVPLENRYVNQEWVILNREMSEVILKNYHLSKIISKSESDQESWPSTLLSCVNLLDKIKNKKTTYVCWNQPSEDGYLPRQFNIDSELNRSLLKCAKAQKFLFARKVLKSFPLEVLLEIIKE